MKVSLALYLKPDLTLLEQALIEESIIAAGDFAGSKVKNQTKLVEIKVPYRQLAYTLLKLRSNPLIQDIVIGSATTPHDRIIKFFEDVAEPIFDLIHLPTHSN